MKGEKKVKKLVKGSAFNCRCIKANTVELKITKVILVIFVASLLNTPNIFPEIPRNIISSVIGAIISGYRTITTNGNAPE